MIRKLAKVTPAAATGLCVAVDAAFAMPKAPTKVGPFTVATQSTWDGQDATPLGWTKTQLLPEPIQGDTDVNLELDDATVATVASSSSATPAQKALVAAAAAIRTSQAVEAAEETKS